MDWLNFHIDSKNTFLIELHSQVDLLKNFELPWGIILAGSNVSCRL